MYKYSDFTLGMLTKPPATRFHWRVDCEIDADLYEDIAVGFNVLEFFIQTRVGRTYGVNDFKESEEW